MATTEGLNLLCHALAQQEAKRSIAQILCHPQRDQKGKEQNLAMGGAKPSAPFPLSTSSALLPYSTMCPLRVILGRDLVTFECPIKRRRAVRAPAWVAFRHVADEQAAVVPVNPLTLARLHLPPTLWFFFMLTSPVCSASLLHKHTSLHGKRSPASLIAAYLWSRRL